MDQVRWLVERGATPKQFVNNPHTDLDFVKEMVKNYGDIDMPQFLITKLGADLPTAQFVVQHGFKRHRLLEYSKNLDVRNWVISTVGSPDEADECLSATKDSIKDIKILLDKGADPKKALSYNCTSTSIDIIKMLIEDYKLDLSDENVAKLAVNAKANSADYVMYLVSKGLSPNIALNSTTSSDVIHKLVEDKLVDSNDAVTRYLDKNIGLSASEIQFLLDNGADPTQLTRFLSRHVYDPKIVRNIIEKGADPNKCLPYIGRNPELLRLLIAKGVGVNNAAPYAVEDQDFKTLLDKGAEPSRIIGLENMSRNVIFMCVEKGGDPQLALKMYCKDQKDPSVDDFKILANLISDPEVVLGNLATSYRFKKDQKHEIVEWAVDEKGADINGPAISKLIYNDEDLFKWVIKKNGDPNNALKNYSGTVCCLGIVKKMITNGVDVDKLLNIHFLIGHQIIDMLNAILK